MSIYLAFNSKGTMIGYGNKKIRVGETVKQVSESELNEKIPDSFDADNWKEVRRHYKLEDGEIVFDEDYSANHSDE